MKHAYIFPGQGSQFPGMGKELFINNEKAKKLFEEANDILGFDISSIMFEGSADDLNKQKLLNLPCFYILSFCF